MKYLILVVLVLNVTILGYADQNVFYDKISGFQIVDVSGKKTKMQISQEFNIKKSDLQELTINEETEGISIVNGVMVKTDLIAEELAAENKIKLDKEAKQKPAIDKLKALGWTDSEIKSLLND